MDITSIVIVGVGGTGSYVLPPLLRYLNSQKTITNILIVDGDKYDEKNIDRQEFAHSRLGLNKADVQKEIYSLKFKDLNIYSIPFYLGSENIDAIIEEGSVVFSCVDNHSCRNLLSKRAQQLNNCVLISGGNEVEDGNVQIFCRQKGVNQNNPIEVRHPEIERTDDGDRSEMSCEELSHLPSGGQVIFANLFSATLMCSLFYAFLKDKDKIIAVDDIFFDVKQVKTLRVINGNFE